MGTKVIYNGVVLNNVQTKVWDQEVVYDPSNTDVLFCRYKMHFTGIVHIQTDSDGAMGPKTSSDLAWVTLMYTESGSTVPSPITDDIGALLATIKARLSESRCNLQVYFGDKLAINCLSSTSLLPYSDDTSVKNANGNRGDVDNGPKPKRVSITHVAGNKVFRIAFEIECAMVQTHSGDSISTAQGAAMLTGTVLNNRWSVGEVVDDQHFVTRTIRGKLRISTPMLSGFYNVKNIVVPSLEAGFRRDRIEYSIAEDMLTVDYSIVDKQVHISAPWPAVKMDADYTESTDDGVSCFAEVFVRLEGSPASPVPLLIQRALQIIDTKIQFSTKGLLTAYQLMGASITEHLGERNGVEVRMRVRHLESVTNTIEFVRLFKTNFTGDLSLPALEGATYDPGKSTEPKIYGYDPRGTQTGRDPQVFLMFLECYAQDPWGPMSDHAINSPDMTSTTDTTSINKATTITRVSQGSLPPESSTNLSTETLEAVYTYVRAETRYHTIPVRAQLPIAGELVESADTCIVFDLGGKQAKREIHVDAERIGQRPEIPEPVDTYTDGDIKGTLLKHWERSLPPTLAADKTQKIYRIEAYYLYALNRPPKKTESTRIGVLQNTKFTQAENAMTRTNIYTDRMKIGQ